jgi:hypothetical protein
MDLNNAIHAVPSSRNRGSGRTMNNGRLEGYTTKPFTIAKRTQTHEEPKGTERNQRSKKEKGRETTLSEGCRKETT